MRVETQISSCGDRNVRLRRGLGEGGSCVSVETSPLDDVNGQHSSAMPTELDSSAAVPFDELVSSNKGAWSLLAQIATESSPSRQHEPCR